VSQDTRSVAAQFAARVRGSHQPPLTEQQVRDIVREEIDEALERAISRMIEGLTDATKFPQYRDPDFDHE